MPLFQDKKEAIRHARLGAEIYGRAIGVESTHDGLWEASEAAATPFAIFVAYPSGTQNRGSDRNPEI